jgi:hypothetical protein
MGRTAYVAAATYPYWVLAGTGNAAVPGLAT